MEGRRGRLCGLFGFHDGRYIWLEGAITDSVDLQVLIWTLVWVV